MFSILLFASLLVWMLKLKIKDKAISILCTLPESWGQVVSSIFLSKTDTLEFDTVVGALLSEELRKKYSF